MNAQDIIKKLESTGLSRREIAAEIGVSLPTLNGWMAPNAPRPVPLPNAKLLERIYTDTFGNTELRFTYSETELINRAIPLSGCKNYPDFAHHTIMTRAKELTEAPPQKELVSLVADAADLPATELPERKSVTYHRAPRQQRQPRQ